MKKWEKFSKEELEQFVKEMIEYYNFNISHFKGQGWSKDYFYYERFTSGKVIKSANAIEALVNLRGHKCE